MMLECVLIARDKWLKPVSYSLWFPLPCAATPQQDGVMWPSHATLYLVPCTAQQEYDDKITFWKNVCGMDFSPLMYACTFVLYNYYHHSISDL